MSAIIRLPDQSFTDTTLPKLYRDKTITADTKWLYDFKDTASWSKQSNPISTDVLKSLTDTAADATFGSTPPTFDAAGAFAFASTGGGNERIVLNSARPAASDTGFMAGIWFEHGTQASSTGLSPIFSCADNNSTKTFLIHSSLASSGLLQAHINNECTYVFAATPAAGSKWQVVMVAKKQASGKFYYYLYVNGALVYTKTDGTRTDIVVPTLQAAPQIGGALAANYDSGAWVGKVYRAYYDTLAGGEDFDAIIKADWNDNKTRLGFA